MAVASGFLEWEKDEFFPAAEEVQEAADSMESLFRAWIRNPHCEDCSANSQELLRELFTALGTAKWQLEEFERAVHLNNAKYFHDESVVSRRRQFVSAIYQKISTVERTLHAPDRNLAFNWVELDGQECDDLVTFLSSASQPSHAMSPTAPRSHKAKSTCVSTNDHKGVNVVNSKVKIVMGDDIPSGADQGHNHEKKLDVQKNLSLVSVCEWAIAVDGERADCANLIHKSPSFSSSTSILFGYLRRIGSATKLRWLRNSFWKCKNEKRRQMAHEVSNFLDSEVITRLSQRFNGRTERSRNCLNSWKEHSGYMHPPNFLIQIGCPFRIATLLVLAIFLIGIAFHCRRK